MKDAVGEIGIHSEILELPIIHKLSPEILPSFPRFFDTVESNEQANKQDKNDEGLCIVPEIDLFSKGALSSSQNAARPEKLSISQNQLDIDNDVTPAFEYPKLNKGKKSSSATATVLRQALRAKAQKYKATPNQEVPAKYDPKTRVVKRMKCAGVPILLKLVNTSSFMAELSSATKENNH